MVKSLWASVQGDPVFMRRVNGYLALFWIAMIPVSIVTGWVSSVVYVSALSLWALVSGHWSAWQAARVEVRQEEEAKKHEKEDLPGEVVERLVTETTVDKPPAAKRSPGQRAARKRADPPTGARGASATGQVKRSTPAPRKPR